MTDIDCSRFVSQQLLALGGINKGGELSFCSFCRQSLEANLG